MAAAVSALPGDIPDVQQRQAAPRGFGPGRRGGEARTERRLACEVCGVLFRTEEKLHVHTYAHTGERFFRCSQPNCTKAFVSKYKLFRHIATHSSQKTHQCTYCEKMFHRKDHLKNHLQTHDPNKEAFKCGECGKNYNTKLGYKRHLAMHAATSGDLTCKVCLQTFESTQVLLEHLKAHSGKSSGGAKEKKHQCEHCERRFYTRKDVRRHMVVHTGRKDFLCQYCAQRFGRKDHLTRHVKKSHSQELLKIKTEPPDMLGLFNSSPAISVKEELSPMLCTAPKGSIAKTFSGMLPMSMYNPHLQAMQNSGVSHSLVHSPLAMGIGCHLESHSPIHTPPPPQPPPKYQLGSASFSSSLPDKIPKVEIESFLMDLHSSLPLLANEPQSSPPKVGLEPPAGPLEDLSGEHLLCKSPAIISDSLCAANMDFSHLLSFLPLNLPPYNPPVSAGGLVMGYSQGEPQNSLTSLQPQPQDSPGSGGSLTLGSLHSLPPVFTNSLSTTTLPRFHQAFQ
ncbi:zinc finger protein PLAGL2 [Latimeria chalumnae]|uniref:PLAG1 like zinc finger 2 n=1 Tax=Latimeria chalumnae TaxID=7897 RepID=H3ACE1_LATCH|nr:PREDICTED: zinc finger protein PLAGL2 [Latimeria chalumnae]|eukprot:XP_006012026.1 PREDICTED: zinc finger protein PLAGL2 [Latimeria chalumnae]